ncbi:RNA methyltransferase, partial [Pseudoalteromonas sp. S1609]
MISTTHLKLIAELGQKTYRKHRLQYLVLGENNVLVLLNCPLKVTDVFATQNFIDTNQAAYPKTHFIGADDEQLSKVSTLVSNNAA